MSRRTIPLAVLGVILAAASVLGAAPPSGTDPNPGDETARAIALYDEGRYDEARPLLEAIDRDGRASGPMLYRLFICRSAGREAAPAREALDRARERLDEERVASPRLETYFYLANSYANLGRSSDASRVALEGLGALESGRLGDLGSPMALFQAGKLNQDAGRNDEASRLYRRALEAFGASARRYTGSERWARRFLASEALAKADYATASADLAALVALGGAAAEDWNRLAVARARLGRFGEAADAWREATRIDPQNADDPRYASRLAQTAAEIGGIPPTAPSGTLWTRLSREEIEAVLKQTATAVLDARAQAVKEMEASTPSPDARRRFEELAASSRAVFVAAGLEYACRRLPIRETAFREGYAVLIFQSAPWTWPEPPQN